MFRSRAGVAAGALFLVTSPALTACGGSNSGDDSGKDAKTLTLWHYEGPTSAMGIAWNKAIEEFKASHPGVTVKLEEKSFEQIQQNAQMILNSDSAPDIMEYNKGNATAGLLAKQGLLTDLSDQVIYNKDLFKKYDLQVPIIFTVIQSAFGTYLLTSVYAEFPTELLEAAGVDGAGRWRTLWRVVVPVSRPTLGVLFTFFFIWTRNELLLPLVFLVSNDERTVPVALGVLPGDRLMDATTTSASALIGISRRSCSS